MAKQYQILINEGKGPDNGVVQVTQGVGDQGNAVRLIAQRGARYELQDLAKGKSLAPDHVRLKRVGSNLNLMFDGSQKPDVILEDYYASAAQADGMAPVLAGLSESGDIYEYVPHDPAVSSLSAALKDGNAPVMMSLGGGPVGAPFVLSGLPIVAGAVASGGIGGMAIGAGVLGAAALAGGGGGAGTGGNGVGVPPEKATGALATESDSGISNKDGVTQVVTPFYSGKAAPGSEVAVTVNGQTYLATPDGNGDYKVPISYPLAKGVYTPSIKVTDPVTGLSTTSEGTPFTVDDSSTTNQPSDTPDPNTNATLEIAGISDDTGTSRSDFITADNKLVYTGKVNNFVSNHDVVKLVLKNSQGEVVNTHYVEPTSNGDWTWDNSATVQDDGQYTLTASVVDLAGNPVTPDSAAKSQVVVISNHSLTALADTAVAVEAGASNATGTSGMGNVLSNDVVVSASDVKKAIAATFAGKYGQLTLLEDGNYTYAVNNANATVNALRPETTAHPVDTLTDVFTYQVVDAAGQSASAEIRVTIQGANDLPNIGGVKSSSLSTSGLSRFTQGALNITDPEVGESEFQIPNQLTGAYGAFTFELHGSWTYTLKSEQAFTDTRHDLLTVTSFDGSAFATVDITINANLDPVTDEFLGTSQTFSTNTATGLRVVGKSNVTDTLLLSGSDVTLDLTAATTHASSIEKIDLTGTGNNKVVLNLSSVLQADAVNGVHKLYILGNAGDTVQIAGMASVTPDSAATPGYNVYHLDSTHDLLIQQALTFNG